ncbi:hypothetical protein EV363DRAFT_1150200, partial [Boletus edulis]
VCKVRSYTKFRRRAGITVIFQALRNRVVIPPQSVEKGLGWKSEGDLTLVTRQGRAHSIRSSMGGIVIDLGTSRGVPRSTHCCRDSSPHARNHHYNNDRSGNHTWPADGASLQSTGAMRTRRQWRCAIRRPRPRTDDVGWKYRERYV